MAETGQPAPHGSDDGFYTCERCGKVKAVASACTCGGKGQGHEGQGGPLVPEGWDPALTQTGRPRLRIVLGSDRPAAATPDPEPAEEGERDPERR